MRFGGGMMEQTSMMTLDALSFRGRGLSRPECVIAHSSGLLFVPDWSGAGGVAVVGVDGEVRKIEARDAPVQLRPNGIALLPGGAFLLAHMGAEEGGLYRLQPDGHVDAVLLDVDGRRLPPCNFALHDARGRVWLTVSTRRVPRADGYRPDVDDGFIVLLEDGRARIVAEGLGYTNECAIHPGGEYLYVNETFARRLTRFRLANDGTLSAREVVARFGVGTFPDGLAFDREGGAWITSIVSNRVLRVDPAGGVECLLEDADAARVAEVEAAFVAGTMGRPHLDTIVSRRLRNISNLAFGGPDLSTAFLGCLLGDAIASFRSPIPGAPPPHWSYDLGPLAPRG